MSNIKFKFKKLTPMKMKHKLNKNLENYFLKLSISNSDKDDSEQWFNLKDIYEIVEYGDCLNPITKQKIDNDNCKRIKYLYNNLIQIDSQTTHLEDKISENKLLEDHIEIFENQIDELYNKQEDIYALLQEHQHTLEKITNYLNI